MYKLLKVISKKNTTVMNRCTQGMYVISGKTRKCVRITNCKIDCRY